VTEPTQQPVPTPDPTAELETLRRVNAELLQKNSARKAKQSELEQQVAELSAKLTASQSAVDDAVIGAPSRQLASEISNIPTLWLSTFQAHFKVESKDGVLTVLTKEGQLLKDADGQSVKLDRAELAKYLTESEPESERTKLFRIITNTSKASGAASGNNQPSKPASSESKSSQFGLR
jgi:uncharacterized protein YhaN